MTLLSSNPARPREVVAEDEVPRPEGLLQLALVENLWPADGVVKRSTKHLGLKPPTSVSAI